MTTFRFIAPSNIYFSPSGKGQHCDSCDEAPELIQRDDDREEVIQNRLKVYETQTRPLVDHYSARGLLKTVKADGPVEEVYAQFLRAAES